MGFSRQEYWSGLPFPSPGCLPNAGIEPQSPALQADAWPGSPRLFFHCFLAVSHYVMSDCDTMDWSTPSFLHHLPEFSQTHIHWVSDTIQPCSCRPFLLQPSVFPSIRVFPSVSALHIRWPKYWNFNIRPLQGWFPLGLIDLISLLSKGLSRGFSSTTI